MEKSLGNRAVLWAYVLPFLLVLATLITVLLISENEGLAGLVALLTVVPYYIVLYMLRDKLQRTFIFRIR